jgi:hypothetical protein
LCGKNTLDTHQSSGRLGKRGSGVGGTVSVKIVTAVHARVW